MYYNNSEFNITSESSSIVTAKNTIADQVKAIDLSSAAFEIRVDLDKATKLPLDEFTALGTAFASLPEAFRTITQTVQVSAEGMFSVTDQLGNPIDANRLFQFGDGSGLLASFKDVTGLHQARLHPATAQAAEVATSVPYDPTTLFMAAALMEVNKKLDAIQETQEEMFTYIKNKDKAHLRANLMALSEILDNYRFHWSDPNYRKNKQSQVQDIKKDANEAIIQHRGEIHGKLKKKGFIHVDKDVREKAKAVRSELEEYRLSVYLFAYSSFLEIMLYEKFDEEYLHKIANSIDEHSINYRKLYTEAYNLIEADADSSVRAMALGGLSGAMGFLSKAIEQTPVGDLTPIDEALSDASKGLGDFSSSVKHDMMHRLVDASRSDVRPFIENIENISRLYNEPMVLMADESAVYMLPASDTKLDYSVV